MRSNIVSRFLCIFSLVLMQIPLTVLADTPKSSEKDDQQNIKIWVEPETGMEFIFVQGGCYQMGCGDWTSECQNDEIPVHAVCINDFWLGKYEVTQGQWQKIMGRNPAFFKLGDDYPVETISWEHTQQFLAALNRKTNKSFRLPTEAEWEYAARSKGMNEKYAGGNKIENFSWCSFNSDQKTQKVGTKKPNRLGFHDMSGNVSEWVQDFYLSDYYNKSPEKNPQGPKTGQGHVYRGGCWGNVPGFLRVVARAWNPPDIGINTIGLRILLPELPQ